MVKSLGSGREGKILLISLYLVTVVVTGVLIFVFYARTGSLGSLIALAPVGVLALLALYFAILKRWRWGIYALVLYMPFSGLPGILLYDYMGSGIPSLIKDFVFVIPAYVSFALSYRKIVKRHGVVPVGMRITLILMGCVSLFVVGHLFNPNLISPLVGLIGLKVWLFYMPLYVLGYYLIDNKTQLVRLSKAFLVLGMIPAIFGIWQARSVYVGNTELAYRLYGSAATDVTQLFARFSGAGGVGLVRIPSLFTFVSQYSSFLLVLLAMGYALWSSDKSSRSKTLVYAGALGIIAVAYITTGARSVYVLLPAFLILAMLLRGRFSRLVKSLSALLVLIPLAFGAMVTFLQSTLQQFFNYTLSVITTYFDPTSELSLLNQFEYALRITWLGMGTGMNTGQSRYGLDPGTSLGFGSGVESFPGKTILEIGVPGLIIVISLLSWLVISSYRVTVSLRDPLLRGIGASIFALLVVIIASLYKGLVIDRDPLNVLFWLLAGMLAKLSRLEKCST